MFERSRLNLARWFTLSMGSILVLFAALLYMREARDRLYFFDQSLYDTSQVIASGVEEVTYGDRSQIDLENAPLLGSDAIRFDTTIVFARWYTPDKQLLQFMGVIPEPTLTEDVGFKTIRTDGQTEPLRQLTLPIYREDELLGYIQLAASLASVEAPLSQLRLFLVIGVPVALGVIACTGWALGGMAMQPIQGSYQRLQQFTADASHELRAPLAAIVSNAQLGLMEPTSIDEQTACLKTISEVGESMSSLVGHLLFLARHQGKLPEEAFQKIDGVETLRAIAQDYQPRMTEQAIHFEVNLPEQPAPLRAIPDLLRQAVVNLLDNACRYTPADGRICLECKVQSRWVIIQVSDSGIGIPAADLPHIFERFYRVNKERSRQSGGFGLGLAITHQIVAIHSGQIQVKSQLHQGTQFEIRLPLST